MNTGIDILKPKLTEPGVKNIGKAIISTIKEDLYDIEKISKNDVRRYGF